MSEAPPYSAATVDVVRLPGAVAETDAVAVEEPLEIRINGESVAVTMRTPGHDEELALGFCLSEGLAPTSAAPALDLAVNTIEVTSGAFDPARLRRNFYTSSSCAFVARERSKRSRWIHHAPTAASVSAPKWSRLCRSSFGAHSARSRPPAVCMRRASSRRRASCCASAR